MEEVTVIWTETAKKQLQDIYLYIAEDSILQADRVFEKLVNSTSKLTIHPKKHPQDKYKTDNDGSYRAYELYHYRISYRITPTVIYIVRIRSTHKNPEEY